MQEDMKPGEVLIDGQVYRVGTITVFGDGIVERTFNTGSPHFTSLAAAAVALADEAQWVEFLYFGTHMRVKRDYSQLQMFLHRSQVWVDSPGQNIVVAVAAALRANGITVGGGE